MLNNRRNPHWLPIPALLALVLLLLIGPVAWGSSATAWAARAQDGKQITPQIVGGSPVPDGKYPFIVAILDVTAGKTPYQRQFCGGSLIRRSYVLTAAHCVSHPKPPRQDLRILIGRTVLDSHQGVVRRVDRIIVHPLYDPSLDDAYDVALLKLDKPVSRAPILSVAIGDTSLEQTGQTTTVAGWGSITPQPANGTGDPPEYPGRMQEVDVSIVSDSSCANDYSSTDTPIVGSLMVCAALPGADSCQGDSGGPLFVAVSGGYRQIGIVSFGLGCADPDFPGVYTQLSASAIGNFIQSNLR